jgi:hypothetical protein
MTIDPEASWYVKERAKRELEKAKQKLREAVNCLM